MRSGDIGRLSLSGCAVAWMMLLMLVMPAPVRAGLLVGSVVTGSVHRYDETTGAFIDTAADTSPVSFQHSGIRSLEFT